MEDHVVSYPSHFLITVDLGYKMQYIDIKSKINNGRPYIGRPAQPNFLINPTVVKHEAYGDISNESAEYFFKVRS